MDVTTRNPYDRKLDPDMHALVQKLVERHGVVLDPQDPILILQSMNRHIIENAVDQLQQMVERAERQSRQQQDAYLERLRAELEAAVVRVGATLRTELNAGLDADKLAREVRNQVQSALRREFSTELDEHSSRLMDRVSRCFAHAAKSEQRVHVVYAAAIGALASFILFAL